MPEQHEPPRPHGDPLEDEIVNSADENPAQRNSDATDASGISASDEADGAARKKRYDDGAELVSKID